MAGRKRNAPTDSTPRATRSSARVAAARSGTRRTDEAKAAVPDVYRNMLIDARDEITAQKSEAVERPFKRRRPRERPIIGSSPLKEPPLTHTKTGRQSPSRLFVDDTTDDENLQFEDALLPNPTVQTIVRDTDEEEDDDIEFEDVVVEAGISPAVATGQESEGLSLDLTAHLAARTPRPANRRKAVNRDEKERRIQVHKTHLLCLLSHVEMRNRWCNDPKVQDILRPLLPQKTVNALNPRATLNQFGRSQSLRTGLQEAKDLFKRKFAITERGLRKSLWAEDEEQLQSVRSYLRSKHPARPRLIHIIVSTSGRH